MPKPVYIKGEAVERVDTYKYVGVVFDNKLNWKERIKMNMIGGYKDGSVSGQVSLHIKLDRNHKLNMLVYEWIDLCMSTNR